MNRYKMISRAEGIVAGVLGCLVLLGWALDSPLLKSLNPDWAATKPNGAIVLILSAIALCLLNCDSESATPRCRLQLVRACALAIALIGGLTLAEYVLGINIGIDSILYSQPTGAAAGSAQIRPSANAALSFLLIGLSFLFLERKRQERSFITISQALALPAGLIGLLCLVGYLLGVQQLHGSETYAHMAFYAALGVCLITNAIFFAEQQSSIMRLFTSNSTTGEFIRRLMPVMFLVPLILGWLRLRGQYAGLYGTEFGVALQMVSSIIILSILAYWFGLRLYAEEQKALLNQGELARSKQALEASLSHLNLALTAARIGTWRWEVGIDKLTWDDNTCEIFGLTPGTLEASFQDFLLRVHPDDRASTERNLQDAAGNCSYYSGEFRIVCPDGSIRHLDCRGRTYCSKASTPTHMLGVYLDITERKQSEEKLEQLNQRLQLCLEASKTGTWDWYIRQDSLYFDDTCQSMFGFVPGSFPATYQSFASCLHPEDREQVEKLVAESIENGTLYDAEYRIVWTDGSIHHIAAKGKAYRDNLGQATRMTGVVIDITQRKVAQEQIEKLNTSLDNRVKELNNLNKELGSLTRELAQATDQAEEASRLKSQFVANMSHEIRTPMNGIIGMTNILLKGPLTDKQNQYAGSIKEASQALLAIINDILDFSKIEAGKMDLELVDFDPLDVIEGVAGLLADQARTKHLSLMTFMSADVPSLLHSDPTRLRQVLTNLAGNAIKFCDRGEVIIRAELGTSASGQEVVRFSVLDDGIGLSEQEQHLLFQPFVQIADASRGKSGGTGLGLAISRRLVELMGGEIGVESVKGQGSTFWFTIPANRRCPQPAASALAPALKGLRLLIVSEEPKAKDVIHAYVTAWGMRDGRVSGISEALDILRQAHSQGDPYDVAIVDLLMSDLSTFDFAREVIQDRQSGRTKLVLLTALDSAETGEQAIRSGFQAYLTKPLKQSQLLNCLMNLAGAACQTQVAVNLQQTIEAAERGAGEENLPGRRELILVAEDHPLNQQVTQLYLEELGFKCHIVENGKQALEALAHDKYALVLMDCQMPEMDGFAAAREIRKGESATGKHIPVVAMTANAMQGDRENCIMAGMDDYISKPVEIADLKNILDRFISCEPADSRSRQAAGADQGASSSPKEQPINMSRLLQKFSREHIKALLPIFLAETPSTLEKMSAAIAERNSKELAGLGHYLKGAASMILAPEMERLSKQMEEEAKKESWETASTTLEALITMFRGIEDFVHAEVLGPVPVEKNA